MFVQFIDLVIKKAEQGDFVDTHLTTTSYSSMRDPKDLLLRIPPFPTITHLLQLRLQREHMRKQVALLQNLHTSLQPYSAVRTDTSLA